MRYRHETLLLCRSGDGERTVRCHSQDSGQPGRAFCHGQARSAARTEKGQGTCEGPGQWTEASALNRTRSRQLHSERGCIVRRYVSCRVRRAEDIKDLEAGRSVVGMTPECFAFDAANRSLREPSAGQNIQTA